MQEYFKVFEYETDNSLRELINKPVNEDLIKTNKYAQGAAYVDESVYKRILNKVSNYKWSFVPYSINIRGEGKGRYVEYIGLLIVPGYGVHTGIGTQPLNKKDDSKATAAAKTYAFKNACKEMGLAPNIADEDYDLDVFEFDEEEMDFGEEEETKPKKKKAASEPAKKKEPSKKKKLSRDEQIEEIREAYELEKDEDFVAFIQIWDEDILELDDMDDEDWDDFLEYLEENKEEFDDF